MDIAGRRQRHQTWLYRRRLLLGRYFDGKSFTADAPEGQWVDSGADFYAAVVWTDPAAADPLAAAYAIAWMSNWDYVKKIPIAHDYRGQLSLVRQLRLQRVDDVPRLISTPLPEQNTVFAEAIAGQDQTIAERSEYVWPTGAQTAACRIDLTITRVGQIWPAKVVLSVRADGRFATRFIFRAHDNIVCLERADSGPNQPDVDVWRQPRSIVCDFTKGAVHISLFIDSGSVELFLADGTATMSALITAPLDATGLHLKSTGGSVTVSDVAIRPVDNSSRSKPVLAAP